MDTEPLAPDLTRAVLDRLQVKANRSDLATLDALVDAYTRTVPWESASRMVKWANTRQTADCPRWPEEFWGENLYHGHGGTCFESNYAFFSLLLALGYDGYLTINDMGTTTGCHSAIVLRIGQERWLVDAGYPLYAPLPMRHGATTERQTSIHRYVLRPDGDQRFQVERDARESSYVFTLVDSPVSDGDYRAATTADYGDTGLFLDEVIVNKVIDGYAWRFSTGDRPWHLSMFGGGVRQKRVLDGQTEERLASNFGMEHATIGRAMAIIRGRAGRL